MVGSKVGIGTAVEIEFVGAMMLDGVAVGSAAQAVQTTIAAKINQRFIKTLYLSVPLAPNQRHTSRSYRKKEFCNDALSGLNA